MGSRISRKKLADAARRHARSDVKRLGINQGRYHGEKLEVAEFLKRFREAARDRGWVEDCYARIGEFDFCGYRRGPKDAERRVYLSAGIHGDEPAGPVALRRLVEEDQWPEGTAFFLQPCLNPTGLMLGTRENSAGIDLNRDYRSLKSAEVRAHVEWLNRLPRFDMALLLHEDWEAEGFYLYEVNFENLPSPAERILNAVREVAPIQPTSVVDGLWECKEGIIRPNLRPEERPLWAEAVYVVANKARLSLTLEAPSDFPLEFRAETLVRAVRGALSGF
jgi:protein MpaA